MLAKEPGQANNGIVDRNIGMRGDEHTSLIECGMKQRNVGQHICFASTWRPQDHQQLALQCTLYGTTLRFIWLKDIADRINEMIVCLSINAVERSKQFQSQLC